MKMNEEILKPIAEKYSNEYVSIDEYTSFMHLSIQNGPVKEEGVNGVQIETLGKIWLDFLRAINKKFPCRETSLTITHIEEALMWQAKRTQNRIARGVEGENKA